MSFYSSTSIRNIKDIDIIARFAKDVNVWCEFPCKILLHFCCCKNGYKKQPFPSFKHIHIVHALKKTGGGGTIMNHFSNCFNWFKKKFFHKVSYHYKCIIKSIICNAQNYYHNKRMIKTQNNMPVPDIWNIKSMFR